MMRTTLFFALQCCQCSTMQVKQQKKGSNKWVCVVCNQRQSVRTVFAQSYTAKEVRFFVQSFNMSRNAAEEDQDLFSVGPEDRGEGDHQAAIENKKRRTDWSEYLDPPTSHQRSLGDQAEDEDGGDSEPTIITEVPKEMLKRPRLKNYAYSRGSPATGEASNCETLYKPVFSKKNYSKRLACREEDPGKGGNEEAPRIGSLPTLNTASKWNAYITGDRDQAQRSEKNSAVDDLDEWSRAVFDVSTDLKVEDDIHPDFM